MTLLLYLLDYTTYEICDGNHSKCARLLGLEYNELRKMRKRIEGGGTSGILMKKLLDMYWRENFSLDKVLKNYTKSRLGENYEQSESVCDDIFGSIREVIKDSPKDKQSILKILKHVDTLGESIRRNFCEKYCNRSDFENQDCPMRKYSIFVQSLKHEMNLRM